MLMMMFQQLQLYQQQSDNQYSQMCIGQQISETQDQISIFESNMGSMEDAIQSGGQLANQLAQFGATSSDFQQGQALMQKHMYNQYEEGETRMSDADFKELQKKQNTRRNAQMGVQMGISNGLALAKRIMQSTRDAMFRPLKTKEKRLQLQLKTLESQGTYIAKRLESVEKQLEPAIKSMTPHFGVSQG